MRDAAELREDDRAIVLDVVDQDQHVHLLVSTTLVRAGIGRRGKTVLSPNATKIAGRDKTELFPTRLLPAAARSSQGKR
jgi:hypothetical protein